jgi:hypothetical protein
MILNRLYRVLRILPSGPSLKLLQHGFGCCRSGTCAGGFDDRRYVILTGEETPESEGVCDACVNCGMLGATTWAVRSASNFAVFSTEKSTTPKTITAVSTKSLFKIARREAAGG